MNLVATALQNTWPVEGPLLFLGPWCRVFGDGADNRAGAVVADPWPSLVDRRRAYAESMELFERLLPVLGDALNAFHGTSHSTRFWRIIIGPWLIRYLQILKDRHARLKLALESQPDLVVTVLDPADRVIPADTLTFTVSAYNDAYNFQLATSLAEKMGARTRVVRNSAVPNPGLPRGIFAPLLAAAGRILAKDAAVLFHDIGIGKADEASLSLSTAFRARPLRTSAFRQARTLPQATRTHRFTEGFTSSTDFEKVLGECLSGDIPSCFVEYFPALLEAGRSTLGAPPRVLLSANGWTFDETFKAAAALAAERGTRLVGVQHGGGYGLYARMWQEQLERSVTDAYWCWGWSELDGDRRLRDVPAPSLSFPADDRRPGSGLLFVANAQPRYPYGFQSQALAERCLEGIEDEISFFETLPGTVRGKSSVRITEQDETWGWSAAARIRSRFSDIGVQVARGPLHESLREAALTVIDHPATSLLEALALDRPTILYWRPEVWDARSHVVPLLDGLRRAGVLFDEPLAAARAAAKAWKNPRSWWGRSEVREAIGNFRASLALGAPDWRKRWAEALKDEAAQ